MRTGLEAAKGVNAALADLVERHVVIEIENKYQIAIGMFRRWLRQEVLELDEGRRPWGQIHTK